MIRSVCAGNFLQLTPDDLQRMLKLLSVPMTEERLNCVAEFLNQNFQYLTTLRQTSVPKHLEPTSYLKLLHALHAERK